MKESREQSFNLQTSLFLSLKHRKIIKKKEENWTGQLEGRDVKLYSISFLPIANEDKH